jgi:hypothetical protein
MAWERLELPGSAWKGSKWLWSAWSVLGALGVARSAGVALERLECFRSAWKGRISFGLLETKASRKKPTVGFVFINLI